MAKLPESDAVNELRDNWRAYVRGWWGYYRLAEERRQCIRTGRLDSPAHSQMLLAALAR